MKILYQYQMDKCSPYLPNGTAILKRANILVLVLPLYISAMMVGATHEYEASPTPTRQRDNKNNQNFYK